MKMKNRWQVKEINIPRPTHRNKYTKYKCFQYNNCYVY